MEIQTKINEPIFEKKADRRAKGVIKSIKPNNI